MTGKSNARPAHNSQNLGISRLIVDGWDMRELVPELKRPHCSVLAVTYFGCAIILEIYCKPDHMNLEIPDFHNARVLVVGDLMLDRYWTGATQRVSPEAPVPVVRVEQTEDKPGGAGNVALNVASLGAQCCLLAVVGDDEYGAIVENLLTAGGVRCELRHEHGFSTITKLRVLSQHQQLIRLDFEEMHVPGHQYLGEQLDALLPDFDVVVLSDYGKGTLNEIQQLIQRCRAAGKTVIVDPKGNDFTRYRRASLITPNLKEFQSIMGPCHADQEIHERAQQLLSELELDALLVTRGEQGMSLVSAQGDSVHIPTHAREVFDVTGAGDTVIATVAAALAAGAQYEHAVRLSNIAAGVVVAKLGSATVSVPELKRAAHGQRGGHGVLTEEELLETVSDARANDETIVMTNGCFDILHAGHVHYLNQAAALGDRLVVAVNIDETVRALKGADRPVNNLESRMAVLAGLAAVDWVVPFSEETPERLICAVKPDLLVKGGDNDPNQVPGAACVREAGGKVMALDYIEGRSTTRIISQIRDED